MDMSKEEFMTLIEEIREMLKSDVQKECSCPKKKCEWHGDCHNCIRIHRHFGNHVPNCLQFILNDKIKTLAGVAEMNVSKKEMTPDEYWDYVNEHSISEEKA